MTRILILGGTAEARQLAGRLAGRRDLNVTMSLAGRTTNPAPQPVPVRVGGFGGADGLAAYLTKERIGILIDATHPYAAIIAANAARAAQATNTPLLSLRRPPWPTQAGDRWSEVPDVAAAVRALGDTPRTVFLTLGRKEVSAFAQAPQHHYLVRSVDPVEPLLAVPRATYITGRGPFSETHDRHLLQAHGIDTVVAKNSGGDASYGKIAAARALGIKVILIERPALPDVPTVETIDATIAWLDHALASTASSGASSGAKS